MSRKVSFKFSIKLVMLVFKYSNAFLLGEDLAVGEACSQLLTSKLAKLLLIFLLAHNLKVQILASTSLEVIYHLGVFYSLAASFT